MRETWFTEIDSPVGLLRLAADGVGLRQLDFLDERAKPVPAEWRRGEAPLKAVIQQLKAYFAGTLREFDLPLAPEGTEFQRRVWGALCEIPYGATVSYSDLALRVGNPKGCRAVGLANGRNPIAIVIPCHRVIGRNGTLVGYGGGLPIKQKLLALEGRQRMLA